MQRIGGVYTACFTQRHATDRASHAPVACSAGLRSNQARRPSRPTGLEQTPLDAEVVWPPSGSSRSSMIASMAMQMTRRLSLGVSSVHNADRTDVTLTLEVLCAVREVQRVVQQ
eukprot:scaffold170_cov411-Prasinococcus_capsulatus_cf.AAC.1